MNYHKIHDSIIGRARSRVYNSNIHHKHHIIPIHEYPNSTETVPLTFKEHYVVHLLRYKMVCTLGNLYAYLLLKYGGNNNENHRLTSVMGGTIGGQKTKQNKSGIFSPEWDRSAATQSHWQQGLMPIPYLKLHPEIAKQNAENNTKMQKGIFSPEWDRASNMKHLWKTMSKEAKEKRLQNLRDCSIIGSRRSSELGTNFSTWDQNKQRKVAAQGGSIVGKIPMWTNGTINRRSYQCPGDGFRLGVTLKHKTTKEKITIYKEQQ